MQTRNRWHEDPAFKGVIKRHGSLPHLSGKADNRIASISVQSAYDLSSLDPEGYILGNSPSTGSSVEIMSNEMMELLVQSHADNLTYLGHFYNTDVHAPFWFKHFGSDDIQNNEAGAGDAYHIGVFGKTGSGKSNTAASMLLGYAKNHNNMNILVLDPQGQFYKDYELLPGEGKSFKQEVEKSGMKHTRLHILNDVYLPGDMIDLFGEILYATGFIQEAFGKFYVDDKLERAQAEIVSYLLDRHRSKSSSDRLSLEADDPDQILIRMLRDFGKKTKSDNKGNFRWSKFTYNIYGTTETRNRLQDRIDYLLDSLQYESKSVQRWRRAIKFFQSKKDDGQTKVSIDRLVDGVVTKTGNMVILNLLDETTTNLSENIQAVFIKEIERRVVEASSRFYGKEKANCLIVMDEAHRFISRNHTDTRIKELTTEIINSVRTTRKYGIGYMFITQTIESLDAEILKQMRAFAFGYGLTTGQEFRAISDIVNNQPAMQLYRSFIDPSSNRKFPFMFFGPVSPLSFTGSPLFVNMYTGRDAMKGSQSIQTGDKADD